MSMEYIRRRYGVPAKRGMWVTVEGKPGVITSSRGDKLRVRFLGLKWSPPCHPTWEVTYYTSPLALADLLEERGQPEHAAHLRAAVGRSAGA